MAIRTHRQYSEDRRVAMATEYGLPLAEVRDIYSDDMCFWDEWHKYAVAAFESGDDFVPQAVRTLDRLFLRTLARTTRGLREGMPDRYTNRFIATNI